MLRRVLSSEKVRFLIIGGLNTVMGFSLFALFNSTFGHDFYLGSFLLSYIISLVIGYFLYRRYVFKGTGALLGEFLRYTAISGGSFIFNLLTLPLLVEVLNVPPLPAQALILCFTVVGSYFGHRFFSFRKKPSADDSNFHEH